MALTKVGKEGVVGLDNSADATAINISSGENVGIGVVPETTWNSNIDALQLGLGASIYGDNTATGLQISANTVATLGSSLNGYKYISSDKATTYQQYDGQHNFRVAGSGSADGAITWTTALTIDNSGRVGIGADNMGDYHANNDDLLISRSGSSGITIRSGTIDQGRIAFADGTDDNTTEMRGLLMYNHNGNAMSFFTNSAERMRITSNGSVVIGATATDAKLEVKHNVNATSTIIAGAQLMTANNYHDLVLGHGADYAVGIRRVLQQSTPSYLRPRMDFFVQNYNTYLPTDRVVRMTIHDTGSVSIGTTDTQPQNGGSAFKVESLSRRSLVMSQSGTGNANIIIFYSGGNLSGAINIASGSVSYGSGSDYRIKENIVDLTDATTRLKQLKPKRFNFITNPDDETRDGFLAHEVSSIVPEAVIGEKDAVDENGEIIVQQLDPSKLVPLLVKTIQELEARITELENK